DGQLAAPGLGADSLLHRREDQQLLRLSGGCGGCAVPRPSQAPTAAPHPPAKLRGAGLITTAALLSISITARPRSFNPSERNRNTPSAPLKPELFVSACMLYGSGPEPRASAPASVTAS